MSDYRLSGLEYRRTGKRLKRFFSELDDIDFSCKKVAYLGTGDQEGYRINLWRQSGLGLKISRKREVKPLTIGR
jgi:flavodoxin I